MREIIRAALYGLIVSGLGLAPVLALPGVAAAQPRPPAALQETMDIGDEPGRVSTEEVSITEGPYARQMVLFRSNEAPGTVVIHSAERFLYVVQGNGRALRYGIGVGREGFEWHGTAHIALKREWPTWTPPREMIKRQPELAKFANGMDPGLKNPLGARAMYLFNKGGDMGYRLHGSPEWNSIGKAMSSGCIRLMNQDIIDLYDRASVGAKVIVM